MVLIFLGALRAGDHHASSQRATGLDPRANGGGSIFAAAALCRLSVAPPPLERGVARRRPPVRWGDSARQIAVRRARAAAFFRARAAAFFRARAAAFFRARAA